MLFLISFAYFVFYFFSPQGGRRPGSARPAPPKIVRHTEEEPQDVRITSGNAKLNVILDNNKDDDNEEEKFFVEDPTTLPQDVSIRNNC